MVGVFYAQIQQSADADAARAQIENFEQAMRIYRLHTRSYPDTNDGLAALLQPPQSLRNPNWWKGPYLELDSNTLPPDPWGGEYQYELISPLQFRIWSPGPDGVDNTDDDIANLQ
jgi:general secretion pathway protein G